MGVKRAIKIAEETGYEGKGSVNVINEIVHNDLVVKRLAEQGVDTVASVKEHPTESNVREAKRLIEELLQDFPFGSNAHKAHAYCLLFEPFLRSWFPYTPLYVV